jgi:signal transduction histidine kinase
MTSKGPMLISSRPVITSNHAGPIRGYLVMGRLLNETYVKTLAEQINVQHMYMPIALSGDPEWTAECAHQTALCHESSSRFDDHDRRIMRVESTFSDIYGHAALMIQASIPREVYAKAVITIRFAMVLICISGILILICLWLLMNSNILNPIADLTRQIIKIRGPDNRHFQRSFPHQSDEIGDLYCAFENMLTDQNHFHDVLVDANRRLSLEIEKSQQSECLRISHENKLRKLAAELLFTEERERRRLAGDLHDRIGQALALCQIKLGLLTQMNQSSYFEDKIKEVHDGIEQIIQDTRTLTFEVSPPVLYELGLEAAIEWFAEETEKQHHIKVHLAIDVSETLNNETINVFAFRALRELILNVVKHACAKRIEISIRHLTNRLYLQIVDDGVGFDTAALWPHGATDCGFGLFSIQERAESLGGQFSIRSTPGMGTRAELILPTKLEAT